VFKDNISKEKLINSLSKKTGYSLSLSKKIINDLIKIIIQHTQKGNLNLKNLGSFKIIHKKERIGRNPKTKEEFVISSRNAISFTPAKKISDKIKNLYE
jgi:integration host factor subunit alpha